MRPTLNWQTCLSGEAQKLVTKQDRDSAQPEYRQREVKEEADTLTVGTLRSISVELDQELDRLRVMQETIQALKGSLRKVAGV